ncbi:MAG TPA: hypothetical protein PLV92_16765, partial [Pirellulaceae bacterium]|nr:hypothetical protein [Pirellulaceae bacterium]
MSHDLRAFALVVLAATLAVGPAAVAGDVTVKVVKGSLFVKGSDTTDAVTINMQGTPGQANLVPDAGTTVNGAAGTVAFPGVTKDIVVDARGGDDVFLVTQMDDLRGVRMKGGAGADSLSLSYSHVKRNVTLEGGDGGDTLSVGFTQIDGRARFSCGPGADLAQFSFAAADGGLAVDFGGADGGVDDFTSTNAGSDSASARIKGSGDTDTVTFSQSGWRRLRARLGGGADTFNMSNSG